jgi:hypothetical protein
MSAACTGNQGGSYLTIMSSGGLQFGILQLVASFGNVWADQAYWQVMSTPSFTLQSIQTLRGANTRLPCLATCNVWCFPLLQLTQHLLGW